MSLRSIRIPRGTRYLIFKNPMVGHSTPLPHIETVDLNDYFYATTSINVFTQSPYARTLFASDYTSFPPDLSPHFRRSILLYSTSILFLTSLVSIRVSYSYQDEFRHLAVRWLLTLFGVPGSTVFSCLLGTGMRVSIISHTIGSRGWKR